MFSGDAFLSVVFFSAPALNCWIDLSKSTLPLAIGSDGLLVGFVEERIGGGGGPPPPPKDGGLGGGGGGGAGTGGSGGGVGATLGFAGGLGGGGEACWCGPTGLCSLLNDWVTKGPCGGISGNGGGFFCRFGFTGMGGGRDGSSGVFRK